MNLNKTYKSKNGMTLLEVLLYSAIVVIVAGLAVGTLLTTIRVQNESTSAREVSEQARFILEQMTREVRDSSLIDISTSTPSSKLVLRFGSTSRDYVSFYASGTSLMFDEGTTTPSQVLATSTIRLTTDKVFLLPGSLSFIRIFNPPSKDSVQVSFTLYYNTTARGVSSSTKPFVTTLYRISSSIFDGSLVPNTNDSFDIGTTSPLMRWKNARFSDKLLIGLDYTRESGDVDSSDRLVLGGTSASLKLLGTSTGEFLQFNNYDNNLTLNYQSLLGGPFEALRIASSSGNVLIGGDGTQSYVGEKLEVVGNIISKGTEWTIRTTPSDIDWLSVAYGNGLFVAIASSSAGNSVMTSPDGINWTTRSTPVVTNNWRSITYGNGLFVAVSSGFGSCVFGQNKCVMTSTNGIDWQLQSTPANNYWFGVTYGNGTFVATALSDPATSCTGATRRCAMTSLDGISWTLRTTSVDNDFSSVTYGNGLFVAVAYSGTNNRIITSPDGINWTTQFNEVDNSWRSVTYGNGLFVAVSYDGVTNQVMTSPDGISWTIRNNPVYDTWRSVTYGNGLFVAVGNSGDGSQVMTSPDGINWTARSTPVNNKWFAVTYGNGLFVATAMSGTGNRVMTSGKLDSTIIPHNNIYQGGMTIMGGATGTLSVGVLNPQSFFTVGSTTGATSTSFLNITIDGLVGIGTSTLPTTALSVTGNLRVRDPNNNRYVVDYYSSNSSSTFATLDSQGGGLRPLNFKASTTSFINYKTNTIFGYIDASGSWFLAGSSSTGIRFSSDSATSTILKPQGNLLLADGGASGAASGYVYLQAGRVGIGTITPNSKLQVAGNIRIGTPSSLGSIYNYNHECLKGVCPSDIQLKKNLEPLVGTLDKIIQLNPVSYNWRADEFPELKLEGDKTQVGLIAQEVEKIFPELVSFDGNGFKAINYGTELRLYILEAIKELKAKNDALKERAKALDSL